MKVHNVSVADDLANRWRKSQSDSIDKYDSMRDNPLGLFSVPDLTSAVEAGRIINNECHGLILDVGCGCYHKPSYMHDGQFIGVDPFQCGEEGRCFPSVQSVGERLPFRNSSFDGLTMMSVVDHFLDLGMALRDAYRVLKDSGLLFVWFMPSEGDDHHHCRVVSLESLKAALSMACFRILTTTTIEETAFVWNSTYLVKCAKRS